jgi:cell division protein FtsB
MCLTRTVDCIDFSQLTAEQKQDLEKLRDKLKQRKEALEEEMALLDEGLEKLNEKLG